MARTVWRFAPRSPRSGPRTESRTCCERVAPAHTHSVIKNVCAHPEGAYTVCMYRRTLGRREARQARRAVCEARRSTPFLGGRQLNEVASSETRSSQGNSCECPGLVVNADSGGPPARLTPWTAMECRPPADSSRQKSQAKLRERLVPRKLQVGVPRGPYCLAFRTPTRHRAHSPRGISAEMRSASRAIFVRTRYHRRSV